MADDLTALFRGCPACGKPLRMAPTRDPQRQGAWHPPSLRLELGVPIRDEIRPWRLSTFPDAQGQVIERVSAGYTSRSRDQIFDLCGDGHIFLTQRSPGSEDESKRWNVVAAIGGSATGKSYLLARTLAQQLRATNAALELVPGYDTAMMYEASLADVIEDLPGKALRDGYSETYEKNVQMPPTTLEEMLPSKLLADQITRRLEFAGGEGDLVSKIKEMHVELAGNDPGSPDLPDQGRWGRGMRQPIVMRTRFGRVGSWTHAWTGIADLAGESFRLDGFAGEEQRRLLQSFDGLVWVVDPAINERVSKLVNDTMRRNGRHDPLSQSVIAASNRTDPGTDLAQAQRQRETTQDTVADRLARMEGGFRRDGGGPRRHMHVVLGKADLIRAALVIDGFAPIGEEPASVINGTVAYLEYVLRRTDPEPGSEMPIFVGRELAKTLARLRAPDMATRRERVTALAKALLDHHRTPDRFWQLVERGAETTLKLPAFTHRGSGSLTVPSIDAHLVDSLQENSAARMHVRDLVMSAVGCGLVCALGYEDAIMRMLDDGEQEVRVFLCSALGALPAQEGKALAASFRPADPGASWPKRTKTSAGMTQLMLAILRRARP